jgi:hypothetical protein
MFSGKSNRIFYFCQWGPKYKFYCKRIEIVGYNYTDEYNKLYKEYYDKGPIIEVDKFEKNEEIFVKRYISLTQSMSNVNIVIEKNEKDEMK